MSALFYDSTLSSTINDMMKFDSIIIIVVFNRIFDFTLTCIAAVVVEVAQLVAPRPDAVPTRMNIITATKLVECTRRLIDDELDFHDKIGVCVSLLFCCRHNILHTPRPSGLFYFDNTAKKSQGIA